MDHSHRHGWFYRRFLFPILALLRMGANPRRLAWSIAVGLVVGINPILGTTTLLCLAAAALFRLNLVASQIANHLVYPLQLLLVLPFIHLGSLVFHTAPLPLSTTELLQQARHEPLALLERLWVWEWHALTVWAGIALILIPLFATLLTPLLRRANRRLVRSTFSRSKLRDGIPASDRPI